MPMFFEVKKVNDHIEINIGEYFKLLLKRIWLIALCAVLVGTSVLVYTLNFVTPKYKASVSIYVNNNSQKDASYISSADLAVALRLVATYVNIIQSDTVLDKVIEETGLMLTAAQVRSMISAEPIGETEMFKVTVTTPNPRMSADLANAIATVAPGVISEIIEGSSAKVIDRAKVPTTQSSPSPGKNLMVGAAGGAALAMLVILLQMMMNVRIKNEEDLEKICQIPVLGIIPQLSTEAKTSGKKARR